MHKEIEDRDVLRYVEKKDPWSSHSIIRKWLESFAPGTKVLDIGTSTGMLGRSCSESGFYLKGLEPVNEWAELARPFYCELLCSSLEQAPEEFVLSKMSLFVGMFWNTLLTLRKYLEGS